MGKVAAPNYCMLVGNLTHDPESGKTKEGKVWTKFSLACDGIDKTDYFRVVGWEKVAELCNEHLKRGRKVMVMGRLSTRTYMDSKERKNVQVTEVVASQIHFMDSPKKQGDTRDDAGQPGGDDGPPF